MGRRLFKYPFISSLQITNIFLNTGRHSGRRPTQSHNSQAPLGAAATPIPAEIGSGEEENAPQPSGRVHGVAARTRQQQATDRRRGAVGTDHS